MAAITAGSPPTARQERTGLLTPPGMTSRDAANTSREPLTPTCANMRSGVPATHLAREAVHRLEPQPRTPTADRIGVAREPNVEDQAEVIVGDVEHVWTNVLQHLESRVEPKAFDTVVRRLQPGLLTDRE